LSIIQSLDYCTPQKEQETLALSDKPTNEDVEYSTPKNTPSNCHDKSTEQAIDLITSLETSPILIVPSHTYVPEATTNLEIPIQPSPSHSRNISTSRTVVHPVRTADHKKYWSLGVKIGTKTVIIAD